jgi:hypothetical protein
MQKDQIIKTLTKENLTQTQNYTQLQILLCSQETFRTEHELC